MALSVQLKGKQSVPLCSPTVHVGRVNALIVRGSVRTGTLLGIWGGATRRCRSQVSTTASEPDIQRRIAPGLIPALASSGQDSSAGGRRVSAAVGSFPRIG